MIQYKYFPTVFVCVVDRFLSPVSQRIDCYKYPNSVLQTKKAVFFSNAHHAHHAHAHLTLVWGGNGQDGHKKYSFFCNDCIEYVPMLAIKYTVVHRYSMC